MHLSKITLVNFKNFGAAELAFSPKINCIVGNNGVGKTNLLDAIHYLSICKSYFNPIDSQNIQHNKDFFVIQGDYAFNDETINIYCGVKRNSKKVFKKNNKEYAKLSEHIGLIPLVMVSPADIRLILEGSDERRKFIDGVIAQYDHVYLDKLISYNRVLGHRNSLLKAFEDGITPDPLTIEALNKQLGDYGKPLFERRVDFINQLIPIFAEYYEHISENKEEVNLSYKSDLFETDFVQMLKKSFEKDKILHYTTKGIHKDDLTMEMNGHPIKKVGSQGQQKTFLLALKLAKYDFIRSTTNEKPVILLDDVFDKFDQNRVLQILKLVAERNFGQIFITDTSIDRLEKMIHEMDIDYKIFNITSGEITEK